MTKKRTFPLHFSILKIYISFDSFILDQSKKKICLRKNKKTREKLNCPKFFESQYLSLQTSNKYCSMKNGTSFVVPTMGNYDVKSDRSIIRALDFWVKCFTSFDISINILVISILKIIAKVSKRLFSHNPAQLPPFFMFIFSSKKHEKMKLAILFVFTAIFTQIFNDKASLRQFSCGYYSSPICENELRKIRNYNFYFSSTVNICSSRDGSNDFVVAKKCGLQA